MVLIKHKTTTQCHSSYLPTHTHLHKPAPPPTKIQLEKNPPLNNQNNPSPDSDLWTITTPSTFSSNTLKAETKDTPCWWSYPNGGGSESYISPINSPKLLARFPPQGHSHSYTRTSFTLTIFNVPINIYCLVPNFTFTHSVS